MWSYVKRQRPMTSEFVFFSSNPSLNHIKIEKMSPTNRHKCKNLHSTVQRAKDRRQKFHFCRLPFDVQPRNVKLLISLIAHCSRGVARLLECHILWWILMVNVLTSRKSISNSSAQTLFSGEPVTAGNTSAFTFHLKMQILFTFRNIQIQLFQIVFKHSSRHNWNVPRFI